MRHLATVMVLAAALAQASERGSLDTSFGGGAWIPGVFDSETELQAGPMIALSLEIPMDQGNIILVRSGYRYASTDRPGWQSVSAVPLTIGYRTYPFFKPYAGARGLEPLFGVYGGGVLAWDSAGDDSLETTTTGGGIVGGEVGARIRMSGSASIDLIFSGEWIPVGGNLAGESGKDLSGFTIYAGLAF